MTTICSVRADGEPQLVVSGSNRYSQSGVEADFEPFEVTLGLFTIILTH